MKAILIMEDRVKLSETSFAEIVIWRVPRPLRGSMHDYKYRLAYIANEVCVLRYDNEAGKGDHKHLNKREVPYIFTTLEQLVEDFWADLAQARQP